MRQSHSHLNSVAKGITTSSAMNPSLVLCLIMCPISLIAACSLFVAGKVVPGGLFFLLGVSPAAVAMWQLVKWTNSDPDRLQREDHVERMTEMRGLLTVKAEDGLKAVPVSTLLTSNVKPEDAQ